MATSQSTQTGGELKHLYYFYAFELPFRYSDHEYIIIKIGVTQSPGNRLYNFEHAFDKQFSDNEFKCRFAFKHSENAATTIELAKQHPKFLFIVPFKSQDRSDSNTGEKNVRGLLGLPIINNFTREFKDSVSYPDDLEKHCGLTEWVVCRSETAETIRGKFRSGELSGNVEGKHWDQWSSFVSKLTQILPHIQTASVKVTFQDKNVQVLFHS